MNRRAGPADVNARNIPCDFVWIRQRSGVHTVPLIMIEKHTQCTITCAVTTCVKCGIFTCQWICYSLVAGPCTCNNNRPKKGRLSTCLLMMYGTRRPCIRTRRRRHCHHPVPPHFLHGNEIKRMARRAYHVEGTTVAGTQALKEGWMMQNLTIRLLI